MTRIWILTKFAQSSNCDGYSAGYRLNQLQRMISSVRCEWKRKEKNNFLHRVPFTAGYGWTSWNNCYFQRAIIFLAACISVIMCLRKMWTLFLTLPYLLLGCWGEMETDYNSKEIEKDLKLSRTPLVFKILQLTVNATW